MTENTVDVRDNPLVNAPNEVVDLSADPFSPENIQILQYITLARIYDVLMANLTATNPETAKQVVELHNAGKLLGPPPNMTGEFLYRTAE